MKKLKSIRKVCLERRYSMVEFGPASSSLLPAYSFLASLKDEVNDFSILKLATSSALVKLISVRQNRGQDLIYLSNNKGSGLPIDPAYAKLQFALIASEVLNATFKNGIPFNIAFDNVIFENREEGNFFTDLDMVSFNTAWHNFDACFTAFAIRVDETLLSAASNFVNQLITLCKVNSKVKRKITEPELLMSMLAHEAKVLCFDIFGVSTEDAPNVAYCERVELPEFLTHENYNTVLTQLVTCYFASKMNEIESNKSLPQLADVVEFDSTGRLSFKPNFVGDFSDSLTEIVMNSMTDVADDYRHCLKALSVLPSYASESLVLFAGSESSDLSLWQKTLFSLALPDSTITINKKLDSIATELKALNEEVGNGFDTLRAIIDSNFKVSTMEDFLGRYIALAGYYNSTPYIVKVIDTHTTSRSVRLLECSSSKRRKIIFQADLRSEDVAEIVLPPTDLQSKRKDIFQYHDGCSVFGVDFFKRQISDADLKVGSSYSSTMDGTIFKGDLSNLKSFMRLAGSAFECDYDVVSNQGTIYTVNNLVTLKPPINAVDVIYFGRLNKRCSSGSTYEYSKVDIQSATVSDLLLAFYASELNFSDLATAYKARVASLCALPTECIRQNKFADIKNSGAIGSSAFGLQTFFGKKNMSQSSLSFKRVVTLPSNVKIADIFSESLRAKTEPIDRIQKFVFELPLILLPNVSAQFNAGSKTIKGPATHGQVPVFEITEDTDNRVKLVINVDLIEGVNHAAKVVTSANDKDKVVVYDSYDDATISALLPYKSFVYVDANGVVQRDEIFKSALFFDPAKTAVENIASWIHGMLVSYIVQTNDKLTGAIQDPIATDVLVSEVKDAVEFFKNEFADDAIVNVDFLNTAPIGKICSSLQGFIDDPSYKSASEALKQMDAASYGGAGDINLFVPIGRSSNIKGWVKLLASGKVLFREKARNFGSISISNLTSYVPEDVCSALTKQITAYLNDL